MDLLAGEWDTTTDEPAPRHIVITNRPSDARRYAQRHRIRQPIVVDLSEPVPDRKLLGLDLNSCRIHDITGGLIPPSILAHLRQLATFAGRPLESFWATTTTEQTA